MRKRTIKDEERPRGTGVRQVADMLPAVGGAAFRRFGFVQSSIVSRWREIVGDRYAAVSTPESIRFPQGRRADGVLTLSVEGAHGPMMQHVAPTIMERVNLFFGYAAVARVAIRPGAARPVAPARTAPPSLRAVPAELGESLRTIGDPELRDCLAALAGAVAATSGPPRIGTQKPDPASRIRGGTGPLPHPASQSGYSVGGRVGERAGAASTVVDHTLAKDV